MKTKLLLNAPVSHGNLLALLGDYKRPNDKISYMVEEGELLRIKKGLYLFQESLAHGKISLFQVANIINGPSYVSMFSALAFYGLIPEQVPTIESITTKRAKTYQTPIGLFKFFAGNEETFHLGIDYKKLNDTAAFLIASPTKAICDIIWHTPKLQITSLEELTMFLEKNIRFDMLRISELNEQLVENCIQSKRKRKKMQLFLELIQLSIAHEGAE